MTKERLLGWRKLFLMLTVIPCCVSLEVSIPEGEYTVARGGEITMTCKFTPARPVSKMFLLSWEVFPKNPNEALKPVASFYLNAQTDYAPNYEGRAQLDVDMNSQVSTLVLQRVTMEDSRRYQCSVQIPGDDEGTTAASTFLLVLVPPSQPICTLKGTAEYFYNITLTCHSEEGSPEPTYDWKSYNVEHNPRPLPPKSNLKGGVLSLFNISRETSGFYICTATNRVGSASFNYTLAVLPSGMTIGNTGIGIIAAVIIAAVILLGILIFCCCCKKDKKDKYPEEPPSETEFHDKDSPESGKQYWDNESVPEKKPVNTYADDVPVQTYRAGQESDDDQRSYKSGKGRPDGSDIGSHRYQDDQRDRHRGSRDHLDDQRDRYGGSRDRLDDHRDRYGGSRDRLDDQRERCGSRDRLNDHRDRYGGSRDRLDDHRERYGGSRDRLEDHQDRYRGSRDRLDDQRDRYGGSRDRLDDRSYRRDQYD